MSTICLNMIVKNESKIITRLFDSVLSVIDTYCICDTGSTDDTIQVIAKYFADKNIPGKVVSRPFDDFCTTRNFALCSCLGMSDFVLLMDADMVLTTSFAPIRPDIRAVLRTYLTKYDAMKVLQGNPSYYYGNMRVVKNNGNYRYAGVTHECLSAIRPSSEGNISKEVLCIHDISDGGCKTDKYDRDAKLLLSGIEAEPNNSRYHFYLANTMYDTGQYDKAIEYYKKRSTMGDWQQEVWYSHYRMGLCWMAKNNPEMAISSFLNAYAINPRRVENLFELFKYYRGTKQLPLMNAFYQMAYPSLVCGMAVGAAGGALVREDQLFLAAYIYDCSFAYEFTTIASHIGVTRVDNEIVSVFNHCKHSHTVANTLYNMKFYKHILQQTGRQIFDDEFTVGEHTYRSSSSCLTLTDSGPKMIIRYVSFFIQPDGTYVGKVHTINKCVQLALTDDVFSVQNEALYADECTSATCICVEDMRIWQDENAVMRYMGTGLFPHATSRFRVGIAGGICDNNSIQTCAEIKSTFNNEWCEKNWVYAGVPSETPGAILVVYKWQPMQLCEIRDNKLYLMREQSLPLIFSHVRGSTAGFLKDSEVWFVVHMVSYEKPRHYYHMIAVFTKEMTLKRYSAPFKFEGVDIEFCLSIVVGDQHTFMNYSTRDRTTRIGNYDTNYLNKSVLIYTP